MKEKTVCAEDLKLGTTGDWMNCDIICIIIIKNKDISISTGGRDEEGASLIGCYFTSCLET